MTRTRNSAALEFAKRSPDAVGRHDKQAWLDLFAPRFVVEDPVGGRPVVGGLYDGRSGKRGDGPLERFWDTYIAPRSIRFELTGPDIVSGLDVVRDVTIVIRDSAGVELRTPAHLLYQLAETTAGLRIERLAAHWEVAPVLGQLVGLDSARLRSMASTTVRLMRQQGLGGALAFGRAVRSVGAPGKAAVAELVSAAERGERPAITLLGARIAHLHKVIAAGDTVSATCTADGVPAVLVCYLDRKRMVVVDADVYVGGLE